MDGVYVSQCPDETLAGNTGFTGSSNGIGSAEVTIPTVSEHLANIYQQEELTQEATVRNFRIVQTEGNLEAAMNVDCYNQAITGRGLRENTESNHLQRNIRSHFFRLSTVGLSSRIRTSQISHELKQRL